MHWVEVRHRVPEEGGSVLMFGCGEFAVGWRSGGAWISWDDGWCVNVPTHWMALEPPEVAGGD